MSERIEKRQKQQTEKTKQIKKDKRTRTKCYTKDIKDTIYTNRQKR